MKKITVSLKDRSYDIIIGHGLIKKCGTFIKRLHLGNDAVIITNRTLRSLYGRPLAQSLGRSGIHSHFELIPDSERAKSHHVLTSILTRLGEYDKHKTLFIIALGGGVVGDLAGFVAAVYKRGIPYIQVPTTLLAQVDSAIGGKVAIDLPIAKNLVGAFYQPKMVLSDASCIASLSERQVRNGISECIKYGIIKDKRLFEYLEKNYAKILARDGRALEFVIAHCSSIKAAVVEEDEYDNKNKRVILNYGHTFGHAIEAASGYSRRYYHGEAIAVGMVIAARIALKLGLIKEEAVKRIERLIRYVGLPTAIRNLPLSKIYTAHLRDKKFIHGKNRLVLPVKIGSVKVVEDIPAAFIINTVKECAHRA